MFFVLRIILKFPETGRPTPVYSLYLNGLQLADPAPGWLAVLVSWFASTGMAFQSWG